MQPCDKCGQDSEELIVQSDDAFLCRNCHLGLGQGITEEEYNRLRMMYDKDGDFKKIRHRFWTLGLKRRYGVLRAMGYLGQGESLIEKIERFRLYKIKEAGEEGALLALIEVQEAEIIAENETAQFIDARPGPSAVPSGLVHAGRVNLKTTPTNMGSNSNPWEESQK